MTVAPMLEQSFEEWEQAFRAQQCRARLFIGGIECGHDAVFHAFVKCSGCDEHGDAFLCEYHLIECKKGQMALHFLPCGIMGLPALPLHVDKL